MNRFCSNCGSPLGENSKFCNSCGTKAPHTADSTGSERPPSHAVSASTDHTGLASQGRRKQKSEKKQEKSQNIVNAAARMTGNTLMASPSGGEISFLHPPLPMENTVTGPIKCISAGFLRVVKNFTTVFTDKKRLIPALILAVVWIVLMLLPELGVNSMPVKLLSAVTFAKGGFSNDILRFIGGIIGKGIFATFFMSLFAGGNPLKGFVSGFKVLFSSLKCKNSGEGILLLVSAGVGLILYNFISGYATLWNCAAGIAALLLSIRSLGRNSGFLKNLAGAFTAKKKNGVKNAVSSSVNRVITGMAIGFSLAVLLSLVSFVYLPYCVGAAAFLAGIILKIVSGQSKKQVAASMMLLAFSVTFLLPLAATAAGSDDEWAGTWTLKKVVVNDKSAGLSGYYASDPTDTTVEKATITETSYDHEFLYTGEEYLSNIVHLRDGEYVPIHYHKGEFFKTRITFEAPPKYLREDQRLELPVKFDVYDSYIDFFSDMGYNLRAIMEVYQDKEISSKTRVTAPFPPVNVEVDGKTNQKQFNIASHVPYGLTNGEMMGIRFIISLNAFSDNRLGGINISHTDEEDEFTTAEIIYLYEWKYGVNNLIMNTEASEGPGETGVSVPAAIAVSLLGLLTTAGAAGVAAGNSDSGNTDDKGSTYKMMVYKDFGDAIRYNAPAVPVYARMIEITREGSEINRMDLTGRIEIFGNGPLRARDLQVSGEHMGAFVEAEAVGNTGNPTEGIVSFKFNGEGGSFQNNMTFRLIGDPYIDYQGKHQNQVHVLAGSGREFILSCAPMDFMYKPVLELAPCTSDLFDIRLEEDKGNTYRVTVTDKAPKPENAEEFYESFRVELTAQNEHGETAGSNVEVILCYEGLVPDWFGKEKEIRAYYTDRQKKEMVKTLIGFSVGSWNEAEKTLDVKPSGEIEIIISDKRELCKTIGVSWETDPHSVSDTVTTYIFTAEKPFPSENTADIEMAAKSGELTYTTQLKLMPDAQQYSEDLKLEYERCLYIIETYMEGELREKRLAQCKQTWGKFGIQDYQAYRKQVWKSAENQILQKRDSYLSAAAYADTAIVALEFAKNVGDIAMDMALAPIGGPFAAILIGQAKSSILDMIELYVNDKLTREGFKEFLNNRMEQMIGMIDNFFDPPSRDDPNFRKKAAIWFTCYFVYRAWYHIAHDKDSDGNPAGVTEGLKAAVQEMTLKAVMVAFMNDALEDAKADSTIAKTVKKAGYSKDVDSELGQTAVSTAAELWGLTATAVIGYINSLLGSDDVKA